MSSTLAKLAGWMSEVLQKQHMDDARENGVGGSDVSPPAQERGDTDDIFSSDCRRQRFKTASLRR
jgi:hypothetical protein